MLSLGGIELIVSISSDALSERDRILCVGVLLLLKRVHDRTPVSMLLYLSWLSVLDQKAHLTLLFRAKISLCCIKLVDIESLVLGHIVFCLCIGRI